MTEKKTLLEQAFDRIKQAQQSLSAVDVRLEDAVSRARDVQLQADAAQRSGDLGSLPELAVHEQQAVGARKAIEVARQHGANELQAAHRNLKSAQLAAQQVHEQIRRLQSSLDQDREQAAEYRDLARRVELGLPALEEKLSEAQELAAVHGVLEPAASMRRGGER